jgi:hypothetical protein
MTDTNPIEAAEASNSTVDAYHLGFNAGKEAERKSIIEEYGHMNDGCGCCQDTTLKKALLQ